MSMIKLAFTNFKVCFKNYLSLIISLAFTIMIFLNFQNLIFSHVLDGLGSENARNVEIVVQAITIVLICFMFFFIWYATNVFLMKRKKEIGIYVFMGLNNQKIGVLYMMETGMIGVFALLSGLIAGQLTTQLFQMIVAEISDIAIELRFEITLAPILLTSIAYLFIYVLFIIKGYINILRSSVFDMVSASQQNESILQKTWLLMVKAIAGVAILCTGYYLAIKDGGPEVMTNVLAAVVLVIAGTYLLFGGLIPLIFQKLAKHKHFLYHKERTLWINNVVFRMKQNYRSFAIVSVLMLCSVTALATGFALNDRYHQIVRFASTYSYQLYNSHTDLETMFLETVEKHSEIAYHTKAQILQVDPERVDTGPYNTSFAFVSYSQIKEIANRAKLPLDFREPKDDEVIEITNLPLLSLTMDRGITIKIDGKSYRQIAETSQPFLGYFQRLMSFYLVSDQVYESLLPSGKTSHLYNIKIKDDRLFSNALFDLTALSETYAKEGIGLVKNDPHSNEATWIKILYSVCIFVFMVFVMASGSIIFMKLYNDAFEEKERYAVLCKMGISHKVLKKSIANELRFAYAAPLIVMSISSYFSVNCLAEVMKTDLLQVNVISVACCIVFCYICYRLSITVYLKNAGVNSK